MTCLLEEQNSKYKMQKLKVYNDIIGSTIWMSDNWDCKN